MKQLKTSENESFVVDFRFKRTENRQNYTLHREEMVGVDMKCWKLKRRNPPKGHITNCWQSQGCIDSPSICHWCCYKPWFGQHLVRLYSFYTILKSAIWLRTAGRGGGVLKNPMSLSSYCMVYTVTKNSEFYSLIWFIKVTQHG